MQQFLDCRKTWKLRWYDHLVRKYPDGKLFFGTLFHKHMEHWYRAGGERTVAAEATNAWIKEQKPEMMDQADYRELMELFWPLVNQYMDYYEDDFNAITVLATELQFAIPMYDEDQGMQSYAYSGTIDLVYKQDGLLKFRDYKTVSSIDRYVNNAVLDRQISRYWWALTALCDGYGYILQDEKWVPIQQHPLWDKLRGQAPDEFEYDIVRKDVAKPPKVIKKGAALSVDKSQNTTYELYVEALKTHGFWDGDGPVPAAYVEVLEHLKQQGNKFLRRLPVRRRWSECEAAMEDFHKAAVEMMDIRRMLNTRPKDVADKHLYWNINYDTKDMNQYYPLILAEVNGDNVSMVQASLFEYEKDYDPESDYIEVEE